MARDNFDRRRLRALYERNKRRVNAMADARDRRRDSDDDMVAPRRYIVNERITRMEGFGRNGTRIRQVVRYVRQTPRRAQFSDRSIFRRGNRDRFRRYEDEERELQRDRFLEKRRTRGGGERDGRGRGLFGATRRRLRLRGNGGRGTPEVRTRRIAEGGNHGGTRTRPATNQTQRQRRGGGSAQNKIPTRDELDAQLDLFRSS